MPLVPPGSFITLTNAPCSVGLYFDSVTLQYIVEPYDRIEFDNEKLRTVKEATGALPIIVSTFGNKPVQLAVTCTASNPRPLTPNTLANTDSIKRKWKIKRYVFTGLVNTGSVVDYISSLAFTHKQLYGAYQAHLAKVQMDISYTDLVSLQTDTIFSSLQITGLNFAGAFLQGAVENNMLIFDWQAIPTHEIPNLVGFSTVYKSFQLTIENRVDGALSSLS